MNVATGGKESVVVNFTAISILSTNQIAPLTYEI